MKKPYVVIKAGSHTEVIKEDIIKDINFFKILVN